MQRVSRGFAIVFVALVSLATSSCAFISFLNIPDVNEAQLVGAWTVEESGAKIDLRQDMTFEASSIPIGYVYIFPPQDADLSTKLSFAGTWGLQQPLNSWGRPAIRLNFDFLGVDSYKYMEMSFNGEQVDKLLLTKGDPDSGDFLAFNLELR